MIPNDPTNMTNRNSSLDILEGVMLNITEMNIAGSIPICRLKDKSENSSIGWFNWTTTMEENPDNEPDMSIDKTVSVPLPSKNASTAGNSTSSMDMFNSTSTDNNKTKSAMSQDKSEDLLGRKKGNFTKEK